MADLLDEARRMPSAAITFARGVSFVKPPDHLVALRATVLQEHGSRLRAVHAELEERFGHTSADYLNVFRAAAELAVMEEVAATILSVSDRRRLRDLWEALLTAQ